MKTKRHSRLPLVLAVLVAATIIFVLGTGFYLSPQQNPVKSDVIVVISGGQTTTRAQKGIELFEQAYAPKIVFSGAAIDDGPSNARQMKRQALEAGVTPSSIQIDEVSQNTYENAVRSKEILQNLGAKKIILVSSPYHLRRAKMTFEQVLGADYEVVPVASFDNRWSKSAWWTTPFGVRITFSELFKVLYITVTNNYR